MRGDRSAQVPGVQVRSDGHSEVQNTRRTFGVLGHGLERREYIRPFNVDELEQLDFGRAVNGIPGQSTHF